MLNEYNLTIGVRTWFSTVLLINVLKTISVNNRTETSIATRPKNTPHVNQVRRNWGLHCASLTNVRFIQVEYHRIWQTETENPVLSNHALYFLADNVCVWKSFFPYNHENETFDFKKVSCQLLKQHPASGIKLNMPQSGCSFMCCHFLIQLHRMTLDFNHATKSFACVSYIPNLQKRKSQMLTSINKRRK